MESKYDNTVYNIEIILKIEKLKNKIRQTVLTFPVPIDTTNDSGTRKHPSSC